MQVRARTAQPSDLKLAYKWANDPDNRKMNLKSGIVPLDTFSKSFAAMLLDTNTNYLIMEGLSDGIWLPIAQVILYDDGSISISIDREYRGRRLATPIILAAIDFAKDNLSVNKITAKISRENIPSIKAFERAGFRFKGEITCKGHPCVEYCYQI